MLDIGAVTWDDMADAADTFASLLQKGRQPPAKGAQVCDVSQAVDVTMTSRPLTRAAMLNNSLPEAYCAKHPCQAAITYAIQGGCCASTCTDLQLVKHML
jgi:hypothetical protein